MSLTFTLTDKNSILAACYFPVIDLSDGDYELGLTDLPWNLSYESNVNSSNNKLYFDEDDKEIPKGSYEICDINKYHKRAILQFQPNDCEWENTS